MFRSHNIDTSCVWHLFKLYLGLQTLIIKQLELKQRQMEQWVRAEYLFEDGLTVIDNLRGSILILKHHIPSLWTQCDSKQLSCHVHPCLNQQDPAIWNLYPSKNKKWVLMKQWVSVYLKLLCDWTIMVKINFFGHGLWV